ncbi:MAG: hypothetical protein AAB461_01870, partial [Patescibacteria group bacterium]
GTTALVATIRARSKKAVKPEDVVVVMETAHPDKFPESLKEAHVEVAKNRKHKTLERLNKFSISKMGKKTMPVDLLKIAQKIQKIAY